MDECHRTSWRAHRRSPYESDARAVPPLTQDPQNSEGLFDAIACLVLAAMCVLAFATVTDYGIPWDAQGEVVYAEMLLRYFSSGFRDHSAFEYINLRFYGGGFELPSAILARISPFGVYETRHLFSALLGVAGLAAAWRLTRKLAGARAGLIALGLLALNPSWYGHAFVNARDIPFGTGMLFCLWVTAAACDELPRISLRTRLLFGAALGWTISVRVGGVLGFAFLLAPISLWLVGRLRSGVSRAVFVREALGIAGALAQMLMVGYAVMIVFWPWAAQSPLNPLQALLMFSRFPFDAPVLFDGQLVPANRLPASYMPVQFAIHQPESVLLGIAVALVLGVIALRRRWELLSGAPLRILAVAVAGVFPFAYFVIARPVDYNGMRHFLFVIPPLTVLGALAFERLLSLSGRVLRVGLGVALAAAALAQTSQLIELHPEEYVYVNSLVGGTRGAQGKFELDYWGLSLEEATDKLVQHLRERNEMPGPKQAPYKVYVCGNVWSASTFFPEWLTAVERLDQADFQIAIDAPFCKHPVNSRPLAEVTRDGAVLSYVDDRRPGGSAGRGLEQALKGKTGLKPGVD
jgi:hypothetical protein